MLNFNQTVGAYNPITPALLQRDPSIGAKLPIPIVNGTDAKKPTFVVFTTGCSVCSLGGVGPAEDVGRQTGDNVILVTPNTISEMRQFIATHHLRVFPISDPNNQYDAVYNLCFRPRTFILDSSGRLAWKQTSIRTDVNDLEQAAQAASERNK